MAKKYLPVSSMQVTNRLPVQLLSVVGSAPGEEDDDGEEDELGMIPTPEQLVKINQWIPAGAEPLRAEEVIAFKIVASNNLLMWSNCCWHPDSLAAMAETMPGRVFMINHGDDKGGVWGQTWDSVKTHRGRIFDARHITAASCPDDLLNCAGNGAVNRKIVEMFGYHSLELEVFARRDSEFAQQVRFGEHLDVSSGTMGHLSYYCPVCSNFQSNKLIEFKDPECEHYAPTPYLMREYRAGELSDEQTAMIAPFIVQNGVQYSVEVSSVCTGNLPSARVVSAGDVAKGRY